MDISAPIRRRRKHDPEFKQQLVDLCQPGVSVSGVALAHDVNANLLRRWIKQYASPLPAPIPSEPTRLVAVQVDAPVPVLTDDTIEITLQKHNVQVIIHWPGSLAHACGNWLGTLLK
jgi:transposase